MCGLGGFSGVRDPGARLALTAALGVGIDSRGDNMAGFVSLNGQGEINYQRKNGGWSHAPAQFIEGAAAWENCMMHSRAPGWQAPIDDAHPFAIVRDGAVVLWGAHNGSLDNAWESARLNNRNITVDSQELFELLADGNLDTLNNMGGWGVATWVEATDLSRINLSRLTQYSDLVAVSLKEGGVVYASTMDILRYALRAARLNVDVRINVNEVGKTYAVANGIITEEPGQVFLANWKAN